MDSKASLKESNNGLFNNKRRVENRIESAVEISRREREERRKRMRVINQNHTSQQVFRDEYNQTKDRNKIPHGWLDCPAFGMEIGLIIPSKVPLNECYNDHILPGKRYSFKQVIQNQSQNGRRLGLVIDLTNTTRYYSTSELERNGIKHVKIACKGRDAVPDNASVNTFVNAVNQFVLNQKHTRKYILVHCTHGHNRTGFMIVHYLMRFTPMMNVTQALRMFYDARPPGIYKADYINALYNFYHEIKPESVTCPPTPEWKIDHNGEGVQDDDDATSCHVQENVKKMSNDDILGDEIPYDQEESYKQFCYKMLDKEYSVGLGQSRYRNQKETITFPGSHPVSLNREKLQLLRQRYYCVTWKADGTRYMMLLTTDGCYLIDRRFRFRRVQMRFPCKSTNEGVYDKVQHYTLLDGEMVIDNANDEKGQARRRYLVYDLVAINGQSVVKLPFGQRWNILNKEVIVPRDEERKIRNDGYRYEMEPFGVRIKGFWPLHDVEKVLKMIPTISHEADGLILQGRDEPYVSRTDESLLKWKYPEMNSVDFLFEMDEKNNRKMLFLYERGNKKLMEGYFIEFRDDSDPVTYNGKIVECSWDNKKQVWVYMRTRVDKSTPNDIRIATKVIRSINDNITEEVLLQEMNDIVRLPMYTSFQK